ncbi:MAG: amino acid permease [Bdellovibrionaceae bacterium]|nr:amino acid permease [Pseudobdellovibrionaceae bacterium]
MLLQNLLRKKPIQKIFVDSSVDAVESSTSEHGLSRTLTVVDLTALGIAAIVGAGIFSTIGTAAASGGPAVSLLFIFTAIACGFSALCYAQFASTIPVAGSAYTYAYASMGEFVAWIIGWDLIMEYAIGNIAVAISWSDYFTAFLAQYGVHFPEFFAMDFLTAKRGYAVVSEFLAQGATIDQALASGIKQTTLDAYNAYITAPHIFGIPIVGDIPAVIVTVFVTIITYIGIRESKKIANLMVLLKIGVVLMVIGIGAFYIKPENWVPFAPEGVTGVLKGVSGVFFAYIGFDAISTTAEECKKPQRDLPLSMMYSLIICTILYVLIALVLTGMVPYKNLNVGDPLAYVFGAEAANVPWVGAMVAGSALIALFSVLLVFQIGQPRIWMVMGRDGLLPKAFARVHPKFKTPSFSTVLTGIVTAVPCLFMNLTEVTDLTSIGTLFAFLIVCAGVLMMDSSKAKFKVPYINGRWTFPIAVAVLMYYVTMNKVSLSILDSNGTLHGDMFIFYIHFALMVVLTFFAIKKQLSLIPLMGIMFCSYLMTELGVTNWLRFGLWLVVGLVIYFLYGYKKSHLNKA